MKVGKRIIATALVVIIVAAFVAIPVSAAGSLVQSACTSLPKLSNTGAYAKTHVALQRFLQGYGGQCKTYLLNAEKNGNGGVDGYFGDWTEKALEAYQSARSLETTGTTDYYTRLQIGMDLVEYDILSGFRKLKINGNQVGILLDESGSPLSAIYVLSDGTQGTFYTW